MDKLFITHYFYPGTDPWKNIMLLPEEEAFLKESLGKYAYVDLIDREWKSDLHSVVYTRKENSNAD